jgi:hypothetical protein
MATLQFPWCPTLLLSGPISASDARTGNRSDLKWPPDAFFPVLFCVFGAIAMEIVKDGSPSHRCLKMRLPSHARLARLCEQASTECE